ncbi:lipid A-modifier LpxR family protein [Undibacterium sp. SXout7W]|uniref:lipid A-modifier LpxR family protein n=1 Tax=Undibacterium sp. SXout7W TaxID=3413049 RepID=UPI003BF39DA0
MLNMFADHFSFEKILLAVSALTGMSGLNAVAADVIALPSIQEYKQVNSVGKVAWQLDIDNDSLLMNKDDGFYTSGNRIGRSVVSASAMQSISYGWRIGQDLYTASDIKLQPSQLSRFDHPYAAWLYAGIFRDSTDVTGRSFSLGLDVGCLGPCAGGKWTQTNLHRLIQQPLPQGWDSQLRNEWGVIVSAEASPGRLLPLSGMDIAPKLKLHLGNIQTDVSAELLMRAGHLNTLPTHAASYAYLRTELKAVAYNATIQGGYFHQPTQPLHVKNGVGEVELGYLWKGDQYGVSASLIRRSNEIKELSNGVGAQNFARLQFIYVM